MNTRENSGPGGLPLVVETAAQLAELVAAARKAGKSVGFVPTMGALHAGHLSLVDAARRQCDFTVASIFVNPTQFAPGEDFQRYPRTLEADLAALGSRRLDLVFAPATDEIYPPKHATRVEVAGPALPLEGEFRPGHFSGVATVVLKLFNLVQADWAFFGQKDYQQAMVVRRMVADLGLPMQIGVCPIVRDPDGLALSSRNIYLDAAARAQSLAISRSLQAARELYAGGERRAAAIGQRMREVLATSPQLRLDYAAVVDAESLAAIERIERPAVALVAARVGATRLIDNHLLDEPFPRLPVAGDAARPGVSR
ncbi:MAG TPA: pantoate--beta-alanine ligase [Pirellulales bacterium]|jgi:pantoate--beta-alanine ligase|nr:pantoate--beta-alanine ligase [Pirellulales bacterium]